MKEENLDFTKGNYNGHHTLTYLLVLLARLGFPGKSSRWSHLGDQGRSAKVGVIRGGRGRCRLLVSVTVRAKLCLVGRRGRSAKFWQIILHVVVLLHRCSGSRGPGQCFGLDHLGLALARCNERRDGVVRVHNHHLVVGCQVCSAIGTGLNTKSTSDSLQTCHGNYWLAPMYQTSYLS